MFSEISIKNVNSVRSFNRFYTKKIGLLNQGLLNTRFPLAQARILFEIAQHEQPTLSQLIKELEIDQGYLSRILSLFEKDGLLKKTKSKSDSRRINLTLTAKGKKSSSILNNRSKLEIEELLTNLSSEDQYRLIGAMKTIKSILDDTTASNEPLIFRNHQPGDIGWMTHRHGVLYAEEYNFDETFEALVADILAKFIHKHNPKRERIWIAEQDSEPVGSVMIVDAGNKIAKLRLLLVEPKVRGQGIGNRLINECIKFTRQKGYHKITLWTQSILLEARHLYLKSGFQLIEEKPHHSFGHDLIAETWELVLKN